jgi:hypothetical protein
MFGVVISTNYGGFGVVRPRRFILGTRVISRGEGTARAPLSAFVERLVNLVGGAPLQEQQYQVVVVVVVVVVVIVVVVVVVVVVGVRIANTTLYCLHQFYTSILNVAGDGVAGDGVAGDGVAGDDGVVASVAATSAPVKGFHNASCPTV